MISWRIIHLSASTQNHVQNTPISFHSSNPIRKERYEQYFQNLGYNRKKPAKRQGRRFLILNNNSISLRRRRRRNMRHPYALLRKAQCNPLYSNLQLISRSPTAATTSRVRCHSTHNHNHNHKHENTYKENVEVTIPTMDSPGPLNFSPEDVAGARKYCTELLRYV